VAISRAQRDANPLVRYAGVVPNGIDVDAHPFRSSEDKDDYVVFVGRSNPDKGPELAIDVARAAGLPIMMVTKRAEPSEREHWECTVEPKLGPDVTVYDDIPHDDVLSLVASARAMVFPIQWDEPFGLVMAESLACGTPVITRPLGAAQEIVCDGETGFLCDSVEEMGDAVRAACRLSANACCEQARRRFSADAMVEGYERIYRAVAQL
jgi:glycosyltransferase involved in cell wall biosynthesis